jgi:hypothetical protein
MSLHEKKTAKTQGVKGKTTTLIYDGGHRAEVWTCYRPKLEPREINRWRVVCCDDPADDTTGFALVLYPTDGKGVTTPPSRITKIESVLMPLDMAALHCAHAFTATNILQAMNVLRADVRGWTGRILDAAKLDKLLRFVRDEINVDQYGQPLGQRRAAFDCAALEQFAEAIAKTSGTPLAKLRRSILKSWQPKFAASREARQARLLAFFDGHPKEKFCGIKSYDIDQWTPKDRAHVDRIPGAAATPAYAAVDVGKLAAAVQQKLAPTIRAAGNKVAVEVQRAARQEIRKAKKITPPPDSRQTYFRDKTCRVLVHLGHEHALTAGEASVVLEYVDRREKGDAPAPFKDVCDSRGISNKKPAQVFRRDRKGRTTDIFPLIFRPCDNKTDFSLRVWPLTLQNSTVQK